MFLKPMTLHAPAFDPDTEVSETLEAAHELTRFHRATMSRTTKRISRYLLDPVTITLASELRSVSALEQVIPLDDLSKDLPLSQTFNRRQSAKRSDVTKRIPLSMLGTLLGLAARSNRETHSAIAPQAAFYHRPYPSAGALYPCEIYLILPDAAPVRYDARTHQLVDYGQSFSPFLKVEATELQTPPGCAIVITAVLARAMAKYGGRGYRFACLEAGHLSQNLLLAAAALDLPALSYGSFFDTELEALIGVDAVSEPVMAVILMGGNTYNGEKRHEHC